MAFIGLYSVFQVSAEYKPNLVELNNLSKLKN